MSKLTTSLCRIFYIIFACVFAGIAIAALFAAQKNPEEYIFAIRPSRTVIFCVLWAVIFGAVIFALEKFTAFFEKRFAVVTAVFTALYFAVALFVGFQLMVVPLYDAEALFEGAKQIAASGNLGAYDGYYYIRPNNIGAAVLLSALFKLFGTQNAQGVFIILNCICLALSLLLLTLAAKLAFGKKRAIFAAILMLFCLPLYGYAAIFYTDILAMPFALGAVMLYLQYSKSKKLWQLIASALCVGFGMNIKFTVVIVAIAIVIHAVLQKNSRQLLCIVLAFLLGIGACQLVNKAQTTWLLPDAERRQNDKLPYTHWPMMGLAGDGRWNNADEVFSASFDTYKESVAADKEVISKRLFDYGISGVAALLGRKSMYTFADGTFNLASMADDGAVKQSFLHNYVLYTSPQFVLWFYITTAYLIVIYFASAAFAVRDAFKNAKPDAAFLARLCFFGLWCFLMMWESNSRYLVHFMPILMLCGAGYPSLFVKKPHTLPF